MVRTLHALALLTAVPVAVCALGRSVEFASDDGDGDAGSIRAEVVASGIPGAGAIAQIGTFHTGGTAVEWPITRAVVMDNDVYMQAPEGTVFDGNSSGIDVRGNAQGNVVANNRIRGRAGVALSVISTPGGPGGTAVPAYNEFLLNRVDNFEASSC